MQKLATMIILNCREVSTKEKRLLDNLQISLELFSTEIQSRDFNQILVMRKQGRIPTEQLQYLNLQSLELKNTISGIRIKGANLNHAKLRVSTALVHHSGSTLLDLSNCNLEYANLYSSNLHYVDFTNVIGAHADFAYCELRDCTIANAAFHHAYFNNAFIYSSIQDCVFFKANFSYVSFNGSALSNNETPIQIKNCNFDQTRFANAVFYKTVTFENCSFIRADFDKAVIRCKFIKCCFQSASFKNTNMTNADFTGCDLQLANLETANLRQTNLSQTNLRRANLLNVTLHQTSFSKATFFNQRDAKGENELSIALDFYLFMRKSLNFKIIKHAIANDLVRLALSCNDKQLLALSLKHDLFLHTNKIKKELNSHVPFLNKVMPPKSKEILNKAYENFDQLRQKFSQS
jgi:uncharacterized protein YjbI with pentapeptide repeats